VIILDASALSALAAGQPWLHRLVDNALHSPFQHLLVPALCLLDAEIASAGTAERILATPAVEVEPLNAADAAAIGAMARDGYGTLGTCHAITASLPTPTRPGQHLILTAQPKDYPPGIITVDIDDPRLAD